MAQWVKALFCHTAKPAALSLSSVALVVEGGE